mmetsp:Transcript_29799/g.86465  ORF Transcript_29799/g.86465 Transcript_29799/m.86465 type:complete len:490 (+) Transcript_29799:111-1580(+)
MVRADLQIQRHSLADDMVENLAVGRLHGHLLLVVPRARKQSGPVAQKHRGVHVVLPSRLSRELRVLAVLAGAHFAHRVLLRPRGVRGSGAVILAGRGAELPLASAPCRREATGAGGGIRACDQRRRPHRFRGESRLVALGCDCCARDACPLAHDCRFGGRRIGPRNAMAHRLVPLPHPLPHDRRRVCGVGQTRPSARDTAGCVGRRSGRPPPIRGRHLRRPVRRVLAQPFGGGVHAPDTLAFSGVVQAPQGHRPQRQRRPATEQEVRRDGAVSDRVHRTQWQDGQGDQHGHTDHHDPPALPLLPPLPHVALHVLLVLPAIHSDRIGLLGEHGRVNPTRRRSLGHRRHCNGARKPVWSGRERSRHFREGRAPRAGGRALCRPAGRLILAAPARLERDAGVDCEAVHLPRDTLPRIAVSSVLGRPEQGHFRRPARRPPAPWARLRRRLRRRRPLRRLVSSTPPCRRRPAMRRARARGGGRRGHQHASRPFR